MVPRTINTYLRDAFVGIAATATKLYAARATVARWMQHQAAGTLPPHLRSAMPEVQLTKDFAADAAGAAHAAALRAAHQKYQETVLANAVSG
jgi:glutathione S-transferase